MHISAFRDALRTPDLRKKILYFKDVFESGQH